MMQMWNLYQVQVTYYHTSDAKDTIHTDGEIEDEPNSITIAESRLGSITPSTQEVSNNINSDQDVI